MKLRSFFSIAFTVAILIAMIVCVICDIAFGGMVSWSIIVICSCAFAWLVLFPGIHFGGRKGVWALWLH